MIFRASILSALTVLAIINVAHAGFYITEATKDATVVNSVLKTCKSCPRSACTLCNHGYDNTLDISSNPTANPKLRSTHRALIGFKLPDVPVEEIDACYLEFPDFTRQRSSPIELKFAFTGSNDWDEATVNGRNAPDITFAFQRIEVPAGGENMGLIDATEACIQGEIDGELSIFIEAADGSVKIPSRHSGKPAMLHVMTREIDYEYHN
ncbi:hypothetical protein BGZ93_008273 [Podila epicladia]|nr:hypothetical protein BGZ92_009024 [Podila epicladia]KAG0092556.1 hypothetical protein BGZ93_008273 [Podila epicladia]